MTKYKSGTLLNTVPDSRQQRNNESLRSDIQYLLGEEIEVTDTGVAADTEFSLAHGLRRVPDHVELLVPSSGTTAAYVQIRPSGTAWTNKLVYLKCSQANGALKIRVR